MIIDDLLNNPYFNETDPEVMKDIFQRNHLSEFSTSVKGLQYFIENCQHQPMPLAPFIKKLTDGIESNQCMYDFLVENNVFSRFETQDIDLKYILSSALFLDIFTLFLVNDKNCLKELIDYFTIKMTKKFKKRSLLTSFYHWLRTNKSLFETLKFFTIEVSAWLIFYFNEAQLNDDNKSKKSFYEKFNPPFFARKKIEAFKAYQEDDNMFFSEEHFALILNIAEAIHADCQAKPFANTYNHQAGFSLLHFLEANDIPYHFDSIESAILPNDTTIDFYQDYIGTDNHFSDHNKTYTRYIYLPKEWVDLYNSWNLCFVYNKLDNYDLVCSKLLAPMIISASPENFIHARILSLWFVTNCYFLRKASGLNYVDTNKDTALIEKWGQHNANYGRQLIEEHSDSTIAEHDAIYRRYFANDTLWNLLRNIRHLRSKGHFFSKNDFKPPK